MEHVRRNIKVVFLIVKKYILFTLLFFLSLGCEEDSDQDQDLNQDCQNSSWISFNFQGSSFWDSDLGEYITLDDIDIISIWRF